MTRNFQNSRRRTRNFCLFKINNNVHVFLLIPDNEFIKHFNKNHNCWFIVWILILKVNSHQVQFPHLNENFIQTTIQCIRGKTIESCTALDEDSVVFLIFLRGNRMFGSAICFWIPYFPFIETRVPIGTWPSDKEFLPPQKDASVANNFILRLGG